MSVTPLFPETLILVPGKGTVSVFSPLLRRDMVAEIELPIGQQIDFDADLNEIRARFAGAYHQRGHLSYHNPAHFLAVEELVVTLARDCGLSNGDIRLLRIAALGHDLGHGGYRYRQLTNPGEYPLYSNEECAVILTDELIADRLSLTERYTVQNLILATSFGQNDPTQVPQPSLWRPYAPQEPLEFLLAFADVASAVLGCFPTFLRSFFQLARENKSVEFRDVMAAQPVLRGFIAEVLRHLALVPGLSPEKRHECESTLRSKLAQIDLLGTESIERLVYDGLVAEYLPLA